MSGARMSRNAAPKATPKERVLKKWPGAFTHRWSCGTVAVYRPCLGGNLNMGSGKGYANAWRDAWNNIVNGVV